jgi:hypothetical protein
MSFAWTPPACYDPILSTTFQETQGPWTFYLDHNATIPLPFEELSEYDIVWTEHHYHVVHCLYAWERIHSASLSETPVLLPAEMGSINHTRHCVGLLEEVEGAPKRKVNAIAYLVYDGCVDLNWVTKGKQEEEKEVSYEAGTVVGSAYPIGSLVYQVYGSEMSFLKIS